MTDRTCTLTYEGAAPKGRVVLPTRTVAFTRGEPIEFTAEESGLLDLELWHGERIGPAIDGERTQQGPSLGPGETGELTADGPPVGTITEVLAWVDSDPSRAAVALAAETAGRARASLIKQLTELSNGADGTNNEEG